MSLTNLQNYTQKELEQFTSVCNQLLGKTFVVKTIYRPDKGNINNPDYLFLSQHFEDVRDYLLMIDWDLHKDDFNGYFYVLNTEDANRLSLGKTATGILLALRMIYDENKDRMGLEHDVLCTVREVLEKVVTDYAILPSRPNMDEVRKALAILDDHSVIQKIDKKYSQKDCRFVILPTILTVVSSEKLNAVVSQMRKEEDGFEEAEEDSAD